MVAIYPRSCSTASDTARIQTQELLIPKPLLRGLFMSLVLSFSNSSSNISFLTRVIKKFRDFPGGAVVKNPPANAGDTGLNPGPGRSHMPRSN